MTRTKKILLGTAGGVFALALIGSMADDSTEAVPAAAPATSSTTTPEAPATPAKPAKPKVTKEQENALRAAQNYVDLMGISKAGLIDQLSSSAGDGYPKAAAKWAAENVEADWTKEAIEAAKNYQQISPMSRSGLIEQLSSSAGDQFTKAQATKAADAVL